VFEVVELLLSFRLGFVGGVGVADRTAKQISYQYIAPDANLLLDNVNIRFQASGNVCRVLGVVVGLSLGPFELVELLLGLPFGFVGGVGVVDRAGNASVYHTGCE
jgi:hypothetical protein